MSYLLDTNALSEWRKSVPNAGLAAWFSSAVFDEVFVSVVTLGEIRRGIAKLQLRNDHRQAAVYDAWLTATKRLFGNRVTAITAEIAEQWGEDVARRPVAVTDGLIAATAKVHGWTLVTRNVKDFEPTGVRLLNPFSS